MRKRDRWIDFYTRCMSVRKQHFNNSRVCRKTCFLWNASLLKGLVFCRNEYRKTFVLCRPCCYFSHTLVRAALSGPVVALLFQNICERFCCVTSLQFDVLDRLGGFPTIGKRRHGRNNASLCCVTEAAVAKRTDHRLHTQPRVLGGRQVSYNRESELGRWRQAYCYQPRFDGEHATRFLVEDSGVQPGVRKPSGVVTHFRRLASRYFM